MNPERWEEIKHLYNAALEIEPEKRNSYLEKQCLGDENLRLEIESLLAQEPGTARFMESPALDAAAKAEAADERRSDLVGHLLAHYRIEERIGAGGMGVVYRAHDEQLQREVAIKVLPEARFGDTKARSRLLREARAAAALNHPNICTIHEVGEDDGRIYIAMELIEGEPLNTRLAGGALSSAQTSEYGIQLADALAHAHDHGIAHRDLKSANIVISKNGRAKVLDFGLAKHLSGDRPAEEISQSQTSLNPPNVLMGTLPYMSPEQLHGQPGDARSDIWSLGIVLYEMAAGTRPFQGQTWFELSSAILNQLPAPLPGHVPRGLRAVIERCLEKEPHRRYQQAAELRAALEAFRRGAGRGWTAFRGALLQRPWLAPAIVLPSLLLVLALLVPNWMRLRSGNGPARIQKLAVLPLENLSGVPEDEYLADGIHELLITDLYRFSGLAVIARPSVMAYKGTRKPPSQIARELHGVDALVAGTVMVSDVKAQVTIHLVDASSGEVLWTDRYERAKRDVLSMQNDIVAKIVQGIRLRVSPQEKSVLTNARAVNPGTFERYAKGRFFINKLTAEGFQKGLAYLKEAVEKDPEEPLAWAGVALGYLFAAHQCMQVDGKDPFELAKPYALKAMELDSSLPEAHQALAEILACREWDYAGAEREYLRVLQLSNGNMPEAHAFYSWHLLMMGRNKEEMTEMKRAQELDPLNPVYCVWMGQLFYHAGKYENAMVEARKALELNPELPDGLALLGNVYAEKGMFSHAIACLEKAASNDPVLSRYALARTYALAGRKDDARRIAADLRKNPTRWDTYGLAMIYAALGETDEAFRWLEAMFVARHMYTPWIKVAPEFSPLRGDSRFNDLARRLKLPA